MALVRGSVTHTPLTSPILLLLATILPQLCLALTDAEVEELRSAGRLTITQSSDGSKLSISSNGVPDHAVGSFPNSDNPNSIATQSFSYTVAKEPEEQNSPSCLPMGPIGLMASGAAFFSPYTDDKLDAVKNEVFDSCDGHPDQQGVYHYHDKPDCVLQSQGNSAIVGVALDGFPVYGTHDEDGTKLSLSDLDECHGRTVNGRYRYHVTAEFPYILGCFRGSPDLQSGSTRCYFAKNEEGNGSGCLVRAQAASVLLAMILYKIVA